MKIEKEKSIKQAHISATNIISDTNVMQHGCSERTSQIYHLSFIKCIHSGRVDNLFLISFGYVSLAFSSSLYNPNALNSSQIGFGLCISLFFFLLSLLHWMLIIIFIFVRTMHCKYHWLALVGLFIRSHVHLFIRSVCLLIQTHSFGTGWLIDAQLSCVCPVCLTESQISIEIYHFLCENRAYDPNTFII